MGHAGASAWLLQRVGQHVTLVGCERSAVATSHRAKRASIANTRIYASSKHHQVCPARTSARLSPASAICKPIQDNGNLAPFQGGMG